MKKYHYFYKITNILNGHFYYGVHNTKNLNDGYMGSGKRLKIAIEKYGIENFKKEILNFFESSEAAYEYESKIVTEKLAENENCYNLVPGGFGGWKFINQKYRFVKDKNGNHLTVTKDDPRLLSKELISCSKGKESYFSKNYVMVKDKNQKIYHVPKNDSRYLSGELVGVTKNKITVKDSNNNFYYVNVNDERYLSGKLVPLFTNKKHSDETINKMKNTFKEINHQQGEKNSQFGKCWIHNNIESISIKKEDLEKYISNGWIKGRKMKF